MSCADTVTGFPVVRHRYIKKGDAYVANGVLYIGTWVYPIRKSVAEIIATQRRRRRK